MAWYDPAAPNDPNASYLSQNPAVRDAMLAFGANLLANARKPGMQGVGESLGAGFDVWAKRREQYAKEERERQLKAQSAAGGHAAPIGLPQENAPSIMAAYDVAPGTQYPGQLQSGPGTNMFYPGTSVPMPGAQQPPAGGPPGPPGPQPPPPPQQPTVPPGLPQSPFGPGPWGQPPQQPPPQPPAGPPPLSPNFQSRPPYVGRPTRIPPGLLNYQQPGGGGAGGPFGTPGGAAGSNQAVIPPGANLSDLTNVQMTGEAPGGQGAPRDVAAARAGLSAQDREIWDRLIQQESGGSHLDSRGNVITGRPTRHGTAVGLGQLLPSTFEEMKRKYGIQGDITDEAANAEASARYFKEQLDRFSGDYNKAVMAYNAGPGNIGKGIVPEETRQYAAAILGNRGVPPGARLSDLSNVQMTGESPGGQGAPADNMETMSPIPGASWKQAGLLGDLQQAQAEARGQVYGPDGELTEDAKRTLRLALTAGGPEGFQQALMTMIQQKPESFGNEQTGLFMKYKTGLVEQVAPGKGQDKFVNVQAGDTNLLKQYNLTPPPAGFYHKVNTRTGESALVGEKPEQTLTTLGTDPGKDPKTGVAIPKAPAGFTWQQKSNGELTLSGAKADDQWDTLGTIAGVTYLRNAVTHDMKTLGTKEHTFTTLTPEQAKAALPDSYQPGMVVQQDEEGRKYIEQGGENYVTMTPDEAKAEYKGAYDPTAIYYKSLKTGKPAQLGGTQRQVTSAADIGHAEYLKRQAESMDKERAAIDKTASSSRTFDMSRAAFRDAALNNAEISGAGSPYAVRLKQGLNWLYTNVWGGKENPFDLTVPQLLQAATAFETQRVKPDGAGNVTEWEDKMYQQAIPGLGKDTRTNFIMMQAMAKRAERDQWYMNQKEKYYREHGYDTYGFNEYMQEKDANGVSRADREAPRVFVRRSDLKESDIVGPNRLPDDTIILEDGDVGSRPEDIRFDLLGRKPIGQSTEDFGQQ